MTVLLHGFWGQPQDWNHVLRKLPLNIDVQTPDLYEDPLLGPGLDVSTWVTHFASWCRQRGGGREVNLVGYSMGARLALQAVLRAPDTFARALLLSGNPVLDPAEFNDREAWENNWAEKFQNQPWSELEKGWQEQAVFSATAELPRRRTEGMREKLAQSLINWSPRRHVNGWDELKGLSPAVAWAFGASDQKYLKVAKDLASLPVQGQISVIPNAGHRLNIDAADFIVRWIENSEESK